MKKPSRWMLNLVRLLVAVALLTLLARSLELGKIQSLFRDVHLAWVVAACMIILFVRPVAALRWKILLAESGIYVPFWTLTKTIYISMFVGQFLPGVMGPDVIRGYRVARSRGRTGVVALSLIIDRLVGIYALTLVALAGAIIARWTGTATGFLQAIAVLQVLIIVAWMVASKTVIRLEASDYFRDTRFGAIWDRLLVVLSSIADASRLRHVLLQVLVLSLAVAMLRCLIFYSLYRAFHVTVPFDVLMLFIPMMLVVVLVPVSISGLGVREVTLVHLLSTVDVAPEVSVSVGLAFQLLQIITSLAGATFWLTEQQHGISDSPTRAYLPILEK